MSKERLNRLQTRINAHRDEREDLSFPTTEPHPGKRFGPPPTESPGLMRTPIEYAKGIVRRKRKDGPDGPATAKRTRPR